MLIKLSGHHTKIRHERSMDKLWEDRFKRKRKGDETGALMNKYDQKLILSEFMIINANVLSKIKLQKNLSLHLIKKYLAYEYFL